uniref:Uncharacterized protein n=1 Tax=uncultured bacterium A1Q1_fos_2140 TaxID=1256565 RepID=L7VWD4_9BACT|nr:hypothetical protein [uncultured bacterium A1Q1_fos_2140]
MLRIQTRSFALTAFPYLLNVFFIMPQFTAFHVVKINFHRPLAGTRFGILVHFWYQVEKNKLFTMTTFFLSIFWAFNFFFDARIFVQRSLQVFANNGNDFWLMILCD